MTTTTVLFKVKSDNQNLSAVNFFALGKNLYLCRFPSNNINEHRQFHYGVLEDKDIKSSCIFNLGISDILHSLTDVRGAGIFVSLSDLRCSSW